MAEEFGPIAGKVILKNMAKIIRDLHTTTKDNKVLVKWIFYSISKCQSYKMQNKQR